MPSFKPKANKKFKVNVKQHITLDEKHNECLNIFANYETNTIPKLKLEKKQLVAKLFDNKKTLDEYPKLQIEEIMDIKDRIIVINNEIKMLNEKKQNYYLDNAKYIFEYFENKKDICVSKHNEPKNNLTKNQMVNHFFKINNNSNDVAVCSHISDTINNNIVQKYLCNMDDRYLDINAFIKNTDICQYCFKGELIPLDDDGILICSNCSTHIPYLTDNEKPSYKDPPKEVCFYAYKKINHFKEIVAQFQGKETTHIPETIIEQIIIQIKKERIELEQLNYYKTKEILKKLGFNKYYEHIAFIKNKLGISPPIFSPELEEMLFDLFVKTQIPYAKCCPDYRVNFLNYYFVLNKLGEFLKYKQYLFNNTNQGFNYFLKDDFNWINDVPMLKDEEKLIEQDATWHKMCEIMKIEYFPTIVNTHTNNV